ncbi:GNAT family N-acetyltransferase [Phycicoccus sp. CMS6Z-2]|uniref:GNAT family N-acetyltransferase n=1 Tax=Phycicoccus flavus TaxID=2502783 RepID=A0A8T6QY41_9MICO|nr:GNAT family N-acetyltransferase [Phycicoccus flavus]
MLWDFDTEFDTGPDPVDVLAARFARILPLDPVLALVAEDAGPDGAAEAVGFALLTLRPAIWFDGPVAQLEELYVVPGRRGGGIGSALLARARSAVADRGAPELHIPVDEPDDGARRFYERHGFVNVEPGAEGRMLLYVGPTSPDAAG